MLFRSVAPAGALVYATCTVSPAENEDVVRVFLGSGAGSAFHLPDGGIMQPALTPGGCDSHFCAEILKER